MTDNRRRDNLYRHDLWSTDAHGRPDRMPDPEWVEEKLDDLAEPYDLEMSRERWNRRAVGFPNTPGEPQAAAMTFLRRYFDFKDARVLDVGCGTGRYMWLALENGAAHTTGVELSDVMVARAERMLASRRPGASYEFVLEPWERIDPAERGWEKQFDLAMAVKTPAVRTPEDLARLEACTKRGLFFFNHAIRREPLCDLLARAAGGCLSYRGSKTAWLTATYFLSRGYRVQWEMQERRNDRSEPIEDLMVRYLYTLFPDGADDKQMAWLRSKLLDFSEDGEHVEHTTYSVDALTYVDLRDYRARPIRADHSDEAGE